MEESWISAFEALRLLVEHKQPAPARAICSRAADGVLTAKAVTLVWGNQRLPASEVPARFWWARGHEALEQNWRSGDFETWIGRKLHCRAYGVMFRKSEIEAMLPARSGKLPVQAPESADFVPSHGCVRKLCDQIGIGYMEASSHLVRMCRAGLIASRCDEIHWKADDRFGVDQEVAQTLLYLVGSGPTAPTHRTLSSTGSPVVSPVGEKSRV